MTDSFISPSQLEEESKEQNHKQPHSYESKNTGQEEEEEEQLQPKSSDNRFASPLLEFGYPPAVEEYELGLASSSCQNKKPLLLYLPGFDGTYLSAFFQYPELHTIFEVRCLVSTMDDRSTFDELKTKVLEFLVNETTMTTAQDELDPKRTTVSSFHSKEDEEEEEEFATVDNSNDTAAETTQKPQYTSFFPSNVFATLLQRTTNGNATQKAQPSKNNLKDSDNRPVYLVGESFGGILALEVALSLLDDDDNNNNNSDNDKAMPNINLQGLVLVNAATCYDRSRLAAEGPPVANLPPLFYVFGILKLLPMFLDKVSLPQFLAIIRGKALPSLIDTPSREAYMGRLAFALPFLLKFMPQETFQWRLNEWLQVGCKRLETKLQSNIQNQNQASLRTLIIAGENDLTLPSIAEAERLAQVFVNSHVHVVKQVGHATTCGTCLDLAAEMRSHFPELQTPVTAKKATPQRNKTFHNKQAEEEEEEPSSGRIQMKQVAAEGNGIYFGMEPRYDGKAIGLSPLSYWSREYYRKIDGHSPR